VGNVMLATFPNFVEKEHGGLIGAAVQIVLQAAFFLARRSNQRAEFGFEQHVLAFLGAERDDKHNSAFGKLGDLGTWGPAGRLPFRGAFLFRFGHIGGDCIAIANKSNRDLWDQYQRG
jgi:hypothetical protein